MKGIRRLALAMIVTAASAGPVFAHESGPSINDDIVIRVANNHVSDVRVYAEDSDGDLHLLGRVARGALEELETPTALVGQEYRIKVVPAPGPDPWVPTTDRYALKTRPLSGDRVREVVVWVERDLDRSLVDVSQH